MLPESPWEGREELVVGDRHRFLSGTYDSRGESCNRRSGSDGGSEAIPASLQPHGQNPVPPARKNTAADGARDGSSRRAEGRLGCYILEAFTGTCHRSPAGGDGLGWVRAGWSQWVQRGQSALLGAQRLEEAGLGGPKMGQ